VLDFQSAHHQMLRTEAVSATISGFSPDTAARFIR
jgi:hypothetical protein